jgi:hypothetical protein
MAFTRSIVAWACFVSFTHTHGSEDVWSGEHIPLDAVSCGPLDQCHWERQRSVDNTMLMSQGFTSFHTFELGAEVCFTAPNTGNIGRFNVPLAANAPGISLVRVVLTPFRSNGSDFLYDAESATDPFTTWLDMSLPSAPGYRYVKVEVGSRHGIRANGGAVGFCARIDVLDENHSPKAFQMPVRLASTPCSLYGWEWVATREVTANPASVHLVRGVGLSQQVAIRIHSIVPVVDFQGSPQPTGTAAASILPSESPSPSCTPSATGSESGSPSHSASLTPTSTSSISSSGTESFSSTASGTPSPSGSMTMSASGSVSAMGSTTSTASASPSFTASYSGSAQLTNTGSATTTMSSTQTATASASPTKTATRTHSSSITPTPSETHLVGHDEPI